MTGRSWELDFSGTVKIHLLVLELCSTGKKKKVKKSPHFLIIHIRNLLKTPFPDGLKETREICTECSFQGYVAPCFAIASQRHTRNLTPMFNYFARLQPNNLDIQSSGCLDKHLDIHLKFIKVESKPLEILPGLAWCMLLYPPKRSPHSYLSSTTKSKKPIFNMKRICISHALLRPSLTFIPDNLLLFESTSNEFASPSFISTACPESLQNWLRQSKQCLEHGEQHRRVQFCFCY